MTLVLHGPSYNPSFPKISPEALATDINNELTTYWLPISGGTITGKLTIASGGLNVKNLPTSATGLVSGDVWINGGFLCIIP